jgi:hypothetical protein
MARTEGSRDLSDEQKATILAEKNLRLSTRDEIADKHDVCRDTVQKITPESVSLAVLTRASEIENELKGRIEKVRDKALRSLEYAIETDDIKKEALVNAFATLYDKARVEGGQPTSHIGFSPEQVDKFRNGFRNLLVNLFQNFKADEERSAPLSIEEADKLVQIALGETV